MQKQDLKVIKERLEI